MSTIAVAVVDARATLDEESGEFVLQARLVNGQEVRFSSNPGPEKLAALKEAMLAEPEKPAKPKRRRTKKTPASEE